MNKVGKFISLEGSDGAGKTSNIAILKQFLEERGYAVHVTREPGGNGSEVCEKIREILLDKGNKICAKTEMLLMAASRAEHIEKVILPYLRAGHVVLSDRYVDSSYAYQGFGRGLEDATFKVNQFATDGLEPDFTLFFDIPFEESQRRLAERHRRSGDNNRLDNETVEFKKAVYDGYQQCFLNFPHRMVRIDALPELPVVQAKVLEWARIHFPVLEG